MRHEGDDRRGRDVAPEGRQARRGTPTLPENGRMAPRRPRVLLAIRDLGFHEEVLDFVGRDPRGDIAGAVADPGQMLRLIAEGSYDVMVVCPAMAREMRLRRADVSGSGGVLLVAAEEMTVPVLREAIDAAAAAVFAWPEERDDLVRAIAELPARVVAAPSRFGRVVAVYGARGGAGCTFIAAHLVAGLAESGIKTVLVDLDVDFADMTAAFGIRSDGARTIADLLPVTDELSPDHVEDALYRHSRGFSLLLAPPDTSPDPDRYRRLYSASIALLAAAHAAVVLHTPRGLDPISRTGIDLADEVVMVTGPELLALHRAKRALASFALEESRRRCRVVIATAERTKPAWTDVERVLGVRPFASVRFDAKSLCGKYTGDVFPGRSRRAGKDVKALARLLASEFGVPSSDRRA